MLRGIAAFPLVISTVFFLTNSNVPVFAGPAEEFVRNAGQRAFTSLADDLSGDQRDQRVREILKDSFDITTIARFTLGRYWRLASQDQRHEFRRLFEVFLVQAYVNRFSDLSGMRFRVAKSRPINAHDALVHSEVLLERGRAPVRVGWRIRNSDDNLRIVDVMVDGISMSVTYRDEFAAVIRSNGGKVEGLLTALRKKTGAN